MFVRIPHKLLYNKKNVRYNMSLYKFKPLSTKFVRIPHKLLYEKT